MALDTDTGFMKDVGIVSSPAGPPQEKPGEVYVKNQFSFGQQEIDHLAFCN